MHEKLDDGHSASLGTAGAGGWAAVEGTRRYQTVPALVVCTYLGMRSSDKTQSASAAMASGCAAETGVLIPGLGRAWLGAATAEANSLGPMPGRKRAGYV